MLPVPLWKSSGRRGNGRTPPMSFHIALCQLAWHGPMDRKYKTINQNDSPVHLMCSIRVCFLFDEIPIQGLFTPKEKTDTILRTVPKSYNLTVIWLLLVQTEIKSVQYHILSMWIWKQSRPSHPSQKDILPLLQFNCNFLWGVCWEHGYFPYWEGYQLILDTISAIHTEA